MRKPLAHFLVGLALALVNLIHAQAAEQPISLAELALGEGILESNDGNRSTINAVAVFFRENSNAEVWLLMSKENIYVGGCWQREAGGGRSIPFEITDDTKGGSAAGSGTVFLRKHGVLIARVTMVIFSAEGKMLRADFRERQSQKYGNHRGDLPIAGRPIWSSEPPNACLSDWLPLNCEPAYCQFVGCLPVKIDSIKRGITGHTLIESSEVSPWPAGFST